MRRASLALVAALAGCGAGLIDGGPDDGGGPEPGPDAGAGAGVDAAADPDGVAPPGAVAGEVPAADGDNPIEVAPAGERVLRVEAMPGQHVAFDLRFEPGPEGVVMAVDRWDGAAPVRLAATDGGRGLRVLAVLDQDGPRTFWVRVGAGASGLAEATLTVTRTPFVEGSRCQDDCARLLQLPLPNDPDVDGYGMSGAVYRYQFGRRDLVMFLRHAGRTMIGHGMAPFLVEDLSQWDGETPGVDVGAKRHASHDRGKDVDVSLYGSDGLAPWRSYCDAVNDGGGRECVPGSMTGFDGHATALLIGAHYTSGRVTMCFLDGELIPAVIDGAEEAAAAGQLDAALVPLYGDGRHLQHWPNHDNHVHIRVSEAAELGVPIGLPVPFQAP